MRSVSIIFCKEGIQVIAEIMRDTEMLFIEKAPQLLCNIHRTTIESNCCRLPRHHTPTGPYSFPKSFIIPSWTNKIKISKTDNRMVQQ
jgi:hypothetical protein